MRQDGTLKFFNHDKGYGFITPGDGSKDIFVHITAFERSGVAVPAEGSALTFVAEEDRRGRGLQASQIELS